MELWFSFAFNESRINFIDAVHPVEYHRSIDAFHAIVSYAGIQNDWSLHRVYVSLGLQANPSIVSRRSRPRKEAHHE